MTTESNLLEKSKDSFWKNKKNAIILLLPCALLVVGGIFLLFGNPGSQKAGSKENLPQEWLKAYFKVADVEEASVGGIFGDPDKDGLSNYQEYENGTNPTLSDTDGDGKSDGEEIAFASDPLKADDPGTDSTSTINSEADVTRAVNNIKEGIATEDVELGEEFAPAFDLGRPLVLPEISDREIKIVFTSSQTIESYSRGFMAAFADYSSGKMTSQFGMLFGSKSPEQVAPTYALVDKTLAALRALSVPEIFKEKHKQQIIFFEAMRKIASAQEYMIYHPEDVSKWEEIIYQSRIMAAVDSEEGEGG